MHQRHFRILLLTCALWLASGRQDHGLCGEIEADTQDDVLDDRAPGCGSCPFSPPPEEMPPQRPFELPTVLPSIRVPSLEMVMPTSTRVATCRAGAVQLTRRRGSTRQTLVFIDRAAAGLADVAMTPRVMAACIGCRLDELRHLQEQYPDVSLHLAPSGLVQALGVACVPTIVELSPTDTQQEDEQ